FYGDAPAVRDGVAGVDDQVHEDLLELTRVGAGVPKIWGATQLDIDVLADDPTDHSLDSRHDTVQLEHLGLQHLLPAECQQLPRQLSGSLGRADHFTQIFFGLITQRLPFQGEIAVRQDDGEQVVEVV